MSEGENATGERVVPYVNSLFQQPWWLEAVAPGQWREIVVMRGEEIAARMPIVRKKRLGLTLLTTPHFTHTLGPWLRPSEAKYANQLAEQKDLMEELIAQLPSCDYFFQKFSPRITNVLPFHWAGFRNSTGYTYRIEDLTDLDRVWSDFRENIRREIRKAEKAVVVRDDLGVESFVKMHSKTFGRQGMEISYTLDEARRLDAACEKQGSRRMLFAEDAQGRLHAAIYIVWDADTCYYLMGGGDPELRNSGATSVLMWAAIQHASTVSRCFDFEGSMVEPIERFFRAFGARQAPYFMVTKMSRRMRAMNGVREIVAALRGSAIRPLG